MKEYDSSIKDWRKFSEEMRQYYNMDMTPIETKYYEEQEEYFVYSSLWTELRPEHVIGQPVVL